MEASGGGASSLAEAEDGSPLSEDEPVCVLGDNQAMDTGDPGTYLNQLYTHRLILYIKCQSTALPSSTDPSERSVTPDWSDASLWTVSDAS